jgi:hypothetical protein
MDNRKIADDLEAEYLAVANGVKKPAKIAMEPMVRAVEALRATPTPLADAAAIAEREALIDPLYILSMNEEAMEEAIEHFDGSSTGEALKCVLHAQKEIRAALATTEATDAIAPTEGATNIDAWAEGAKFALRAIAKHDLCFLTDSMKLSAVNLATNACVEEKARLSALSAPSPEAPTTDAIAKQDPVALYAHENLCTIKNELAALIADPANPTVDQWPCLNPADRECLQKAYTTIRGMTGTQYTNPAPSPKTAPSDDRIDEEWFYVMDMKIPMVERARIFARAILRASESK